MRTRRRRTASATPTPGRRASSARSGPRSRPRTSRAATIGSRSTCRQARRSARPRRCRPLLLPTRRSTATTPCGSTARASSPAARRSLRGALTTARGLVIGPAQVGVELAGARSVVEGSRIGVAANGAALPIAGNGVVVLGSATGARVGGLGAGQAVTIANTGGAGVGNAAATGVSVRGDRITATGGLAIDVAGEGPTENPAPGAAAGPTPYPVLVALDGEHLTGLLPGRPSATYAIDLYAGLCGGERGQLERHLRTFTVDTDPQGIARIDVEVPAASGLVVATATDAAGARRSRARRASPQATPRTGGRRALRRRAGSGGALRHGLPHRRHRARAARAVRGVGPRSGSMPTRCRASPAAGCRSPSAGSTASRATPCGSSAASRPSRRCSCATRRPAARRRPRSRASSSTASSGAESGSCSSRHASSRPSARHCSAAGRGSRSRARDVRQPRPPPPPPGRVDAEPGARHPRRRGEHRQRGARMRRRRLPREQLVRARRARLRAHRQPPGRAPARHAAGAAARCGGRRGVAEGRRAHDARVPAAPDRSPVSQSAAVVDIARDIQVVQLLANIPPTGNLRACWANETCQNALPMQLAARAARMRTPGGAWRVARRRGGAEPGPSA